MNLNKIKSMTKNARTYQKGQDYYKQGKVEIIDKHFDEKLGLKNYKVIVNGTKPYEATITFDEKGEIFNYYCDCLAFQTYEGPCKHIVATLFQICVEKKMHDVQLAQKNKEFDKNVLSDRNALRLIDLYNNKKLIETQTLIDENEPVKLIPKISVCDNYVELSFTVGIKRKYVVKNIKEFCERMLSGETETYGKELTLTHNVSMFDDDSKPLISYILDRYNEIESYRSDSYYDANYGYDKTKRYIRIGPKNLDLLMDILIEKEIKIEGKEYFRSYYSNNEKQDRWKEKQEYSYRIVDFTPNLDISVEQISIKEYLIKSIDYDFMIGKEHIYIAKDYELYRTDKDFSDKMKNFIDVFNLGSGQISIAEKDMTDFYSNVIAQVQEYLEISQGRKFFEKFMPDKANIKIYLDCPNDDTITAKLFCEYDEGIVFDILLDEQVFDDWAGGQKEKSLAGVITIRDKALEDRAKLFFSQYFDGYEEKSGILYYVGNDDRIYNFVNVVVNGFTKIGRVFTTEKYRRLGKQVAPKVSIGVKLESDLLKINFDLEQFPIEELMGALENYRIKKKYYRMKNGSFVDLKDKEIEELISLVDELGIVKSDLEKGKVEIPKYRALLLNNILKKSQGISFDRDGHFKSLIRGMSAIEDCDYHIPDNLLPILRNYQKDGFQWLKAMTQYGFCGVLADEMGLGKTLQIITLFEDACEALKNGNMLELCNNTKERKKQILALVVSPTSLVLNWEKEIQKFAPNINVLSIIGKASQRKQRIKEAKRETVILTSYDLLRRDLEQYIDIDFDYCVIDEAQYIKNHLTQNAKAVKLIKSKQRFALTGTPIENRLSELWSIFDFLMPQYLFSYNKFKEKYEIPIIKDKELERIEVLKRQVAPFMLRRLKRHVLKELPEKIETVVYAKLDGEQEKLYKANLAKAKLEIGKEIREGKFESNKIVILALLTRLRQICCHPALCYDNYKQGSYKLDACMEIIEEAISGNHKILLFSQFTSMFEIIEEELKNKKIKYYKITGKTSKEKRAELVDLFNHDNEYFENKEDRINIFLISLKAGGTGLNLTSADVVIHYDPWWNIAAQNQATDRAHRIGQKKTLQVYKIIAEGTIEEKILALQEDKEDLAEAIVTENQNLSNYLNGKYLMQLLE